VSTTADRARGDAGSADVAAVYRRHERPLRTWLARRVTASPALVEDACASAWLILVAKRPACGERIFGWLCTVALHKAYRLSRLQRREQASEIWEQQPALVPARRDDLDTALEARRALEAVASLRECERRYMSWQVAGYRYEEMQRLAGRTTHTHVNRHLTRAHGRLRQLAEEVTERDEPGRERGRCRDDDR
jgi:hypothetical protein